MSTHEAGVQSCRRSFHFFVSVTHLRAPSSNVRNGRGRPRSHTSRQLHHAKSGVPRRRRAISRERNQLCPIFFVAKAAANHSPSRIHQKKKCTEFLRAFNGSGYDLRSVSGYTMPPSRRWQIGEVSRCVADVSVSSFSAMSSIPMG